jgi:hypothetical protein
LNITSETQLRTILLKVTEQVIDIVSIKLYKHLMDKIGQYIYRGDNAQYAYGSRYPTGEFAESWQHKTTVQGNEVKAIIDQDYSVMSLDSDNFIHGSNYYSQKDAREWIAYYINEGKSGDIFGAGWWQDKRPFFDETVKLIDFGTVDRWIKQEYKKLGFTIK